MSVNACTCPSKYPTHELHVEETMNSGYLIPLYSGAHWLANIFTMDDDNPHSIVFFHDSFGSIFSHTELERYLGIGVNHDQGLFGRKEKTLD